MSSEQPRIVEVRVMVLVLVNVTEPGFTEARTALRRSFAHVAEVVASEVVSNLESVPYVESVIVSQL
jgi:hypothetical protein